MQWLEVKIYTTTFGIEPVSAMLLDIGVTGMIVEDDNELKDFVRTSSTFWDYIDEELLNKEIGDTKITVYLSDNAYGRETLLSIKDGLNRLKNMDLGFDLGKLTYETVNKEDTQWLEKWKEFYKPFKVGDKILIKPIWEEVDNPDGRIIFTINPGNVFGTGLHQSTQLCIVELEKYVDKSTKVLDLGCGSGILSVISLLLGAESAVGVDIDYNAIKTAYENAENNGIGKDKYYVTSGNILDDEKLRDEIGYKKYDIVVANIIADVIIAMSSLVKKQLKDDGVFVCSGIIQGRKADVLDALDKEGFKVININERDEWVSITAKIKE